MEAHSTLAPATSRISRLAAETKRAFRTTDFWIYIALLSAVLIAGTVDSLWLYAALLPIGCLISRGLVAKQLR